MKNIKVANYNVRLKDLFTKWLETTIAFHKLPTQPLLVVSNLLYYHHIYSKDVTNDNLVWKLVFDYDTKIKIMDEVGIDDKRLNNIFTDLRKRGIIVNNRIREAYIPNLEKSSNSFRVVFNFNIVDE